MAKSHGGTSAAGEGGAVLIPFVWLSSSHGEGHPNTSCCPLPSTPGCRRDCREAKSQAPQTDCAPQPLCHSSPCYLTTWDVSGDETPVPPSPEVPGSWLHTLLRTRGADRCARSLQSARALGTRRDKHTLSIARSPGWAAGPASSPAPGSIARHCLPRAASSQLAEIC